MERLNPGQGRRKPWNIVNEEVQIGVFPFCINGYSSGVIEDPSPNPVGPGEIVDKGPEADSLDDAGNFDSGSLHKRILTLF
jgi:hypothetical protein